jgi:hypothetical protein
MMSDASNGVPEPRGDFLSREQAEFEVLARRQEVARLYLSRRPIAQIAAELGVARATIHRDLVKIRKAWMKEAVTDLARRKAEEWQRLDNLECTAFSAWERSLLPIEKRRRQVTRGRAKKDGASLPELTREETRLEDQHGDPRYLEIIYKCVAKLCELLGLTQLPSGTSTTVTVVGGIDLAVVLGHKKLPPRPPDATPPEMPMVDGPPALGEQPAGGDGTML